MLSRDEVLKLAELARLKLDDAEIPKLQNDLEEILSYVETLKEVDTTGVEPRLQFIESGNALREDVVMPSLPVEEALKNAPDRVGDFFKVPKVVDN